MEAEYYQAGPPLHWPCTTRRRKRDDDEDLDSPPPHMDTAGTEAHQAEEKLKAVAHELGHEVRVFSSEKFAAIPSKLPGADQEEDDEFYELQPADYFNLISNRMAEQSKMLKTRKIREAELAAQRAKRTKAVMRVRFPDGYILEADFLPSERIHSLVELLMKVIARPDLPFYLYTVPPKKRILDTSQDFYTVGFVPGANVHFSYDLAEAFQFYKVMSPQAFEGNTTHRKHGLTQTHTHSMETASYKNAGKGCVHKTQSGWTLPWTRRSALNTDDVKSGPYLREEIRSLDGLSLLSKPASHDSRMNTSSANQPNESQSDSAAATNKKPNRPKWFKR